MYSISLFIFILVGFIFFYIANQYSKNTIQENMTTANQQQIITLLKTKIGELENRIPAFTIGQVYQNATDSKIEINNGVSDPRILNEVILDIHLRPARIGSKGNTGQNGATGDAGVTGKRGILGLDGYWF